VPPNADYPFVKGHGTENDFVLLPDHDGRLHGDLPAARVVALCDRRAGIGGDGVIRVARTSALAGLDPSIGEVETEWFMDYRNGDGSVSEMCGNGVRVFARHLADQGLVSSEATLRVGTRAGVKTVVFEDDGSMTVDMGTARVLGESKVSVGPLSWSAVNVDVGNPHAVAFVDDLADAGPLREEPSYDARVYPHGVNVEFVVRRGAAHVAMRVHERGSGETRSCGTGACAVMVAAALAEGVAEPQAQDVAYRVDVPGGSLVVTWTPAGRVLLRGPAEIVAEGTTSL
jgi:diaminopimelate epimerase